MKLPPHIETAVELIQLYDQEKAGKITQTGKEQLALLRSRLQEEMQKLPMPKFEDPFGLLED